MDAEQFSVYRHKAVHELMHLNKVCGEEFRISSWPRWDYELGQGTLTFSQDGAPKVRASIQVIGTTSISGGTWMWSWANKRLPANVTEAVTRVREFGIAEGVAELTEAVLPDDEHLGWGMTAVAAKILGAQGAYRCPSSNGFLYVVYSSIGFVRDEPETVTERETIECSQHRGGGVATYICEHLLSKPHQEWFSNEPSEDDKWPDAWCANCEALFQEQGGEWNDNNQPKRKIVVVCHHCYEKLRSHRQTAANLN